eukprot:CAMPEP_0196582620 /NCGR_PEP_ID=MMETSP1081-20130531/39781_1 /TAXON_ID=36882 /ORGANISM="Pyramimonas amylifera, Strain CCMP720" /LENGTH=181 /DNA_ID=CAMNT_0041903239 /DNA_START=95 /DNA_END=637 /DNA_ORIENTATION=-
MLGLRGGAAVRPARVTKPSADRGGHFRGGHEEAQDEESRAPDKQNCRPLTREPRGLKVALLVLFLILSLTGTLLLLSRLTRSQLPVQPALQEPHTWPTKKSLFLPTLAVVPDLPSLGVETQLKETLLQEDHTEADSLTSLQQAQGGLLEADSLASLQQAQGGLLETDSLETEDVELSVQAG